MKTIIKQLSISALLLIFSSTLLAEENTELKTQINTIDERLTNLEMKEIMQKINMGIDLKVMSNYYSSKDNALEGSAQKVNQFSHALLFRLNLDSSIANRINVFASLESFSFFNDTFVSSIDTSLDHDGREAQKGTEKPRVTKAYFDWHLFPQYFTFSAGRLPTTKGPPAHMPDGVERTGTYPLLAYSIPLDGFAGTLNIHSFFDSLSKKKLIWRLIYKPGSSTDYMFAWRGRTLGDETAPSKLSKNHELLSTMLEYEHGELPSIWKNMLNIFQFGNYRFGGMTPDFQILNLGSGGFWPAELYSDNDEMLRLKVVTHYLELNKILQSQFDFYASWARTWATSKAHLWAQPLPSPGAPAKIDLGPYVVDGQKDGWRYLLGLRYEFKDQLFLGGEWAKSTADSLATTLWSDDVHSIAFMNGESYHAYLTKLLYRKQFTIRTGYIHTQFNKDLQNALLYKNSKEQVDVMYLSFLIHI